MSVVRPATPEDLPGITVVRTSVRENHLSVGQMAERGITHDSLTHDMRAGCLATWVAEGADGIVAFAMADLREHRIFALFTHPEAEGQGYGARLLNLCEQWLATNGATEARLDTGRGTKALEFYIRRGWIEDAEKSDALNVELVKRL